MENASKALLMAAGILIGLLIISLGVYLFVYFGQETQKTKDLINEQKIVQYNTKFTVLDNRKDIKIHEIISLINEIRENNIYYKNYGDFAQNYETKIYIGTTEYAKPNEDANTICNQLLNAYGKEVYTEEEAVAMGLSEKKGELKHLFQVVELSYNNKGKVNKIVFKEV